MNINFLPGLARRVCARRAFMPHMPTPLLPAHGYTHIAITLDHDSKKFYVEETPVVGFDYSDDRLIPLSLFSFCNKYSDDTVEEYVKDCNGRVFSDVETHADMDKVLKALGNDGFTRVCEPSPDAHA